ncbi:MAG TPA: serine/threonine-protein kinase [Fimbriiglobus sp.]|jgi:serine/threonine protein kinase
MPTRPTIAIADDRAAAAKTNPLGAGDNSTVPFGLATAKTAEVRPIPSIPGYEIEAVIGEGGMGAVYAASDTNLRRKVAIKLMLPEYAANPSMRDRFLREARSAAAVEHENVVTIYHVGEVDGQPYLVMPLLRGRSLKTVLKGSGRLSLAEAVRIGRETAAGLAAAHACGLIHRDIKPGNLWIDEPSGRVKILDFGLAKPVASTEENISHSGDVLGTPAYMAPEQAAGGPVDARADLFSLGVVLYELLTGTQPFAGPNILAILTSLATKEPTPVRSLNPGVPYALAHLVHALLVKHVVQRNVSAAYVEKALSGLSVADGASSSLDSSRGGLSEVASRELVGRPQPIEAQRLVEPEPERSAPEPIVPAPPWAKGDSPAQDTHSEVRPSWLTDIPPSRASGSMAKVQSHRSLPPIGGSHTWRLAKSGPIASKPYGAPLAGNMKTAIVVAASVVLVLAFFAVWYIRNR